MKVLLSWLREFAPGIQGDPDDLSDVLSGLGLTVEETTITGGVPDGVVLARVTGLRPHPDADRIQLVDMDDGSGGAGLLQVCCGAFNMAVGDLVPLARVGTVMPNGLEIKSRQLRGQRSEGMCCSEAELGMGDDADGIMILNGRTLDAARPGMPLDRALGLGPDVLWDLDVGANRPDAMCVMGVARDLAAKLGVPFEPPDWSPAETAEDASEAVSVEIEDPTLCGRFSARLLRNVSVGPSPRWLADRLIALGMRPINNIVDISNYVMLELGQPSHAFDLARLPEGRLRVRRAEAGERLVTLDGTERELAVGDGVIADGRDRVIGIAGVMGGASTEISPDTTDVLLEMAWWDPPSVSRTVKHLNLPSEAATRFRRGADWGDNVHRCFRRFAQLAADSGATLASGTVEAWGTLPDRSPLRVRAARVNGLLGTALTAQEMVAHLSSIGFEVEAAVAGAEPGPALAAGVDPSTDLAVAGPDEFDVVVPTWRWDTATETDIAEEVARLHGYENIPRTVPSGTGVGGLTPYQKDRRLVRAVLVGADCDEIQPMPFLAPGALSAVGLPEDGITLANPLDDNESVLRTSLLPGFLKAVAYNQRHFNGDVRFFEIGHVYLPPLHGQLLPDEREYLGVMLSGEEAPAAVAVLNLLSAALALPACELRQPPASGSAATTPDLRSTVVTQPLPAEPALSSSSGRNTGAKRSVDVPPGMHPTRSAVVVVAGRERGVVGEVAPDVLEACGVAGRAAWLHLDLGEVLSGPRARRRYRPLVKYPPSDVDLAFAVPESVPAAAVERAVRVGGGPLLATAELFDVYRGTGMPEGVRSLAYRLRFQAADRTLTDTEVAAARQSCIDEAARRLGVALRS